MLNLIIDLALLAILIFCTLKGRKRGFISGLIAVFAIIVALYASNLIAKTYSGEFRTMLEPFISGVVDKTADETTQTGSAGGVKEQAYEALRSIGVIKSAADNIAEDIAKTTQEGGYVLRNALVAKLCEVYAYVLTAAVVFILIIILFTVAANIVSLDFKLPGMDSLDSILGLVFGLIKGILFVCAIAWAARFAGLLLKEAVVDRTILLRLMMNINPIIGISGF